MSFYLSSSSDITAAIESFNRDAGAGKSFRMMYGRDASVVNPESVMDIARELNKKFMTK